LTLATFFLKPVGFHPAWHDDEIAYAFRHAERGFAIYRGVAANLIAAYVR